MEGNTFTDIFLTKGMEYILILLFLGTFIFFWRYLQGTPRRTVDVHMPLGATDWKSWFSVASGMFYHQGHGWAKPEKGDVIRIGMDDFAQKMIGKADSLTLPRVGTHVKQGHISWTLNVKGSIIPFLSPVEGEVISINEEVRENPSLIHDEPYTTGWLALVRTKQKKRTLNNLLHGRLVDSWMQQTSDKLRSLGTADLGVLYQDGGMPVSGFARNIDPDNWETITSEFFLTS